MFKSSIQWKILALFMVLTLSVMIFVAVFSAWGTTKYYHEQFSKDMKENTFTESVTKELSEASLVSLSEVTAILENYSIRVGVDSYRDLYVLSGKDGECLYSITGKLLPADYEMTDNVISALSGKVGDKTGEQKDIMDYALPLKSGEEVTYIVYVLDTKVEMYEVMKNILSNILIALAIGVLISVFLGFVLSKTLIAPIKRLKESANVMAQGEFHNKIKVASEDEIGSLTESFNFMAEELNSTMRKINEEKNKVETVLLYMTDGVVAFNKEGELIHINPAAMKLLDVTEETVGTFDELFGRLDTDISMGQFLYVIKEPIERNIDFGDKHFRVYLAPLVSGNKIGGVVSVFQDYTKQKKLDNARREFVANVSHELKTPITVVKSYAETLMDYREHDETEDRFLEVINSETDRMTRLINDLLSLSRLDNNQEMKKLTFDLSYLVSSIVERLTPSAKDANQEIIKVIKKAELKVLADRDRIEQVIINIVGNALKYTPEGGKVTVTLYEKDDDAFVEVKDTGMGIPKEDLGRIFERFYRVDKARSRSKGGTGLGLAIAKEIIDAHKGDIKITSKEGAGTKVLIRIPII